MYDVEDFDELFARRDANGNRIGFMSYSDLLISDIHDHQTVLGGRTFFERLLDLLKINGTTITLLSQPDQESSN
jgi:hypothetical protein